MSGTVAGRSWGGCQHHHGPFPTGQANGGNKATKQPVTLIKQFNRAFPSSQPPCTRPKKYTRLITCQVRLVWRPCIAREAYSSSPRGDGGPFSRSYSSREPRRAGLRVSELVSPAGPIVTGWSGFACVEATLRCHLNWNRSTSAGSPGPDQCSPPQHLPAE